MKSFLAESQVTHKQKSKQQILGATWFLIGPPYELQANMKYEGDQLQLRQRVKY